MRDLTTLFGLAVAVAAVLATIGVWAPRKLWVRGAAVGTALVLLAIGYSAFAELLSRPKPVALEWANGQTAVATVLATTIRENEGIYLWLQYSGQAEPRAYVVPWGRDLAEQLQQATSEAEQNGTGLMMRLPFERSWDPREPKFYAMPQPALPPKDNGAAPQVFERRGRKREHRHAGAPAGREAGRPAGRAGPGVRRRPATGRSLPRVLRRP